MSLKTCTQGKNCKYKFKESYSVLFACFVKRAEYVQIEELQKKISMREKIS